MNEKAHARTEKDVDWMLRKFAFSVEEREREREREREKEEGRQVVLIPALEGHRTCNADNMYVYRLVSSSRYCMGHLTHSITH